MMSSEDDKHYEIKPKFYIVETMGGFGEKDQLELAAYYDVKGKGGKVIKAMTLLGPLQKRLDDD